VAARRACAAAGDAGDRMLTAEYARRCWLGRIDNCFPVTVLLPHFVTALGDS
jgi:hypothetical protein